MGQAWEVIVIGAGAAGLCAAIRSAECGRRTLLLEKQPRPGTKILMSGGTRCNVTHATSARGIVNAFGPPGKFLFSALAGLGPADVVALLAAEGVPTKVEESGKVFPHSDRAADVLRAFGSRLERSGATLSLGEPLLNLERRGEGFRLATASRALVAERVILTSGGKSYPRSGTTGDGYAWAARLGHTIIEPRPALTPITTGERWVRLLQGLSVPEVGLRILPSPPPTRSRPGMIPPGADPAGAGGRPTAEGGRSPADGPSPFERPAARALGESRGSFLFTHFGVSGSAVLDISRVVSGYPEAQRLKLRCDFLPALPLERLVGELNRLGGDRGRRSAAAVVAELLPRRLAEQICELAEVARERRFTEVSKASRRRLARQVKETDIPVSGVMGFQKAEVTAGGVKLEEVDSRTMESRLVPGCYFAGEILDLDGPIGGFNFQAAFSTGWLAGWAGNWR